MSAPTMLAGRWFCPACERIYRKPHWRLEHGAFHSWHCQVPMLNVDVTITPRGDA